MLEREWLGKLIGGRLPEAKKQDSIESNPNFAAV